MWWHNAVFLTRRKNLGHYLNYTVTKMDKTIVSASIGCLPCMHVVPISNAQNSLSQFVHTHPAPYGISYLKAVSQQEQSYKLTETSLPSKQKQLVHLCFLDSPQQQFRKTGSSHCSFKNIPSSSSSLRERYLCVYGTQSLG